MRRTLFLAYLLCTAGLVTMAGSLSASSTSPEGQPQAVVSVVDTGINPYHVEFRSDDPLRSQHPSTYIPGYPEDAEALNLTFEADSWQQAVAADCEEVWSKIEAGQLYWVPGTRIVGAIAFGEAEPLDCDAQLEDVDSARILDLDGHGTMVASRAVAESYGACGDCSIVSVNPTSTQGVTWSANHSDWIDIQSNSWGAYFPLWSPTESTEPVTNSPEFIRTFEQAAQKHPLFWASGNGLFTRFGVVGHPMFLDPRTTPSVIMVGGHDSGYVATWPGFPPDVVSDSCNNWAAHDDQIDGSSATVGEGTSAATPYAAGKTAKMLLHARTLLGDNDTGFDGEVAASGTPPADVEEGPLADGQLTKAELERLMRATAQQRPEAEYEDGPPCDPTRSVRTWVRGGPISSNVTYFPTPVKWTQVPETYPAYLHVGYGAVNNASTQQAFDVLEGEQPMPDREEADRFFAVNNATREALYPVWTLEAVPEPSGSLEGH